MLKAEIPEPRLLKSLKIKYFLKKKAHLLGVLFLYLTFVMQVIIKN